MATSIYYFKGKSLWAKVYDPVPTYDKDNEEWTICLIPDEETKGLIKSSGVRIKERVVETGDFEGQTYFQFRRVKNKEIKGEEVTFDPPDVVGPNGEQFLAKIGNGSTIVVKVSVYDTKMGKGHTLEGVQVIEHIPYEETPVHMADDVAPF